MGKDGAPAGGWTLKELISKQKERAEIDKLLMEAVAYARDNKLGAKAVMNTGKFKLPLTWNMLHNALSGRSKRVNGKRLEYDILTETETEKLVQWIKASAVNKDPASDNAISEKICEILRARVAFNKTRKNSVKAGAIPLTELEKRLVNERNASVSHMYLTHLQARYPEIQRKSETNMDATRAKKMNEHTVQNHFYGDAGLEASMIHHKVMDPETKVIIDPRRVIALDELGQFFEHGGVGPRPKSWGIRGEKLERTEDLNREQASVGLVFGLDGFLYGPQFNVKRANYTAGMTDCLQAPAWAKSFANEIYVLDKKSTFSTMSKSEKGVQTGTTFKQWIRTLRKEVDARNVREVAAGHSPIADPIFVLSDNHGSRFDPAVLESMTTEEAVADAKKLGFALWLEESKTSHFLQMPDRITKQCHAVYKKACKQYKKAHELTYGETCTIGVCEFLEIWGGCADMNYEGAWFSWCSTQTVLAAWRAVGFLAGRLDPTQIDRTNFFDRDVTTPAVATVAVELDTTIKTPPGMRSNSVEAMKHKLEASMNLNAKLLAEPTYLQAPGLLAARVPVKVKTARSGARIQQSEGGDVSLRGLGELADKRRKDDTAEEARLEAGRQKRAAKKARLLEEEEELDALYELCVLTRDKEGNCTCNPTCEMAKMLRCPGCKKVKRGRCRVAACQPPQPLLLTHNPTPLLH